MFDKLLSLMSNLAGAMIASVRILLGCSTFPPCVVDGAADTPMCKYILTRVDKILKTNNLSVSGISPQLFNDY